LINRFNVRCAGALLACAFAMTNCGRFARDHGAAGQGPQPVSTERRREAQHDLTARGIFDEGHPDATLSQAKAQNDPNLLNTFLDAGFSPNTRGREGDTLLMYAVQRDYAELRDRLILDRTTLDSQDANGATALIWAAIKRKPESLRMLLDAKANPDVRTKQNWTALMYAASSGDAASVNLLLRARADATVVNELGWSARDVARIRRFREIERLLPEVAPASIAADRLRIGKFLSTQPEVDFGDVPEGSHAERTIEFRLDEGAAPERISLSIDRPFSVTPRDLQVTTAGAETATIRLEATSATTPVTRSMMVLGFSGSISVPIRARVRRVAPLELERLAAPYRRLLESPGSRESKVEFLQAALHGAAADGDVAAIRALLSAGVTADFVMGGETPLSIAAKTGKCEAVKALIEGGADVHLKYRSSPLESVGHSPNEECRKALRAGGALE